MSTTISAACGLLGPGGLGAPVEHRHAALGQPVCALALPGELHARRAHHDGREGLVGLERGQRLHGLAEALLVGDEGAPALERVAHAGALERMQLAAELQSVEVGVLGVGQRHRGRRAVVLGAQLVQHLAHALVDRHPWVGGDEVRDGAAPARGRRARRRPSAASRLKKRPGRATRWASGRRLKSPRRLVVPDREQRDVGLAVVADLEAQLRRRRLAARLDLAGARGGRGRRAGRPRGRSAADAPSRARRAAPRGSRPRRWRSSSSGGGSPDSVRRTNAPAPSWATTETSARQRSESSARPAPRARPEARGSARAAPPPAWPGAGRPARASACGASRTSAAAAPSRPR